VLSLVGDESEDGFLDWEEVTGLRLNADLVDVSACQSGLGRVCPGEECAACPDPSCTPSSSGFPCALWPVADKETADLMANVDRQLGAGKPHRAPYLMRS
jgi:hypothetical protein